MVVGPLWKVCFSHTTPIIGNTGVVCIHTMLLPDMRILCMERPHTATPKYPVNPNTNGRVVSELRIRGNRFRTRSLGVSTSPFCAGHAQTGTGKIFIAGGDENPAQNSRGRNLTRNGLKSRRIFFPCQEGASTCRNGVFRNYAEMTTER